MDIFMRENMKTESDYIIAINTILVVKNHFSQNEPIFVGEEKSRKK